MGKTVGAMPDGRLAYSPLADNASPMIGMDVNGPTAVVNSLAACDECIPQSGMLLNQRFDPTIAAGEKGLDIIETVFRAHFAQGGYHIQINVLDDETLLAAQREPDKYKNIIVRVAGYSLSLIHIWKCLLSWRAWNEARPEIRPWPAPFLWPANCRRTKSWWLPRRNIPAPESISSRSWPLPVKTAWKSASAIL